MERGWKPNVEISPSCPRCGSSNTKFCYYNNYSLTQPRYFCKGCRRYWTKGGSLRNVPVGGGCRKNRRGKSLRLSSDVGISTKNFAYGIAANNVVAGSYGMRRNSLTNSPSSSAANDGSHIDLARVYANYLNQQSDSGNKCEAQEYSSDQSDAHQPLLNIRNVDESNVHLLEPSSFLEYEAITEQFEDTHLNNNNHIYRSEIESFLGPHDGIQQYGSDEMSYTPLPLLPSEDVASQVHMPWSNPTLMGHDTLQAPDLPLLGGPESQDPNLLVSNWKEFDLSEDSFPGK